MDAEQQAPPSEVTPENAATPEVEASQPPSVNWEERYQHLQPEYTRATQEAAQYRRLIEAAQGGDRDAIEALGLALADDTETDPDEPQYLTRDEWQSYQSQQQAERQQAERVAQIEGVVETQLDELGHSDDSVRDWIVSRAIALPPTADGLPDVKAANAEFEALITAQKKQWASTKRTHQFSPVGKEGTQVPDLTTHEGRVAHAMSRLAAEQ